MRGRHIVRAWLGLLALSACDDRSAQEYYDFVAEARACGSGDSCVVAGAGACTCGTPVNASQQAEVDEAAEDFDCERVETVDRCSPHSNVRCEAGRCVSDESPRD